MISATFLILMTAAYLAVLFYIAFVGDKKPGGQYSRYQPIIFTLSITVYCSSWTFFGAVGKAATSGWEYFSIYLGPMLLFLFFTPFIKKLIAVSKRHRTTSIADFISTRYGKNQALASIVTIIALVGTVPYISLQLKAVAGAFDLLTGRDNGGGSVFWLSDTAFYLGLILAIFSILFGARRIDATEHHRGIINAISFEAIVKITSLIVIAGLSYMIVTSEASSSVLSVKDMLLKPYSSDQISTKFFTQVLLAAAAIICLPRQFHVAAVESRGDEMSVAKWGLPFFLLLVSLAVIPITSAGLYAYNSASNADLFVLSLPMDYGNGSLALLSYLGGFSAATGMVIMATVALSTMVSNDLILPVLFKVKKRYDKHDFFPTLLLVRRVTIFVLLGIAYGYYRIALGDKSLSSIGLISFAAAIQFAPLIIGGLYWRQGHKNGAIIGLLLGFTIWLYTLLLPTLAGSELFPDSFANASLFGLRFLHPQQLFGIEFSDSLSHGVFWSLAANIAGYIGFSLRASHSLTDRLQAASYIEGDNVSVVLASTANEHLTVGDLFELSGRFVGVERTRRLIHSFEKKKGRLKKSDLASDELLMQTQHMVAGSVGSAAAESIFNSALDVQSNSSKNIASVLDQTSQAIQFNRELLQVTLDNITQGISVVDYEQRIVAWNRAYVELFDYPKDFIKIGMPAEDIIQFNIQRTLVIKSDTPDAQAKEVSKRLAFLRSGSDYFYEREWKDGRVVQTQGNRLPDGGFVTTYTDVSEMKQVQKELQATNQNLEEKVEQRTEILSRLNKKLQETTESKTRFLAGASHDLAQPLSAGKLYLASLMEDLKDQPKSHKLAENSLNSLQSAEGLLKGLIEISKIDSGVLNPELRVFPMQELLNTLQNEFSVIAEQRGLRLHVVDSKLNVISDKNMLRSILQNFMTNAIRYTSSGSVMLACRLRSGKLCVEVRDSGIGIAAENVDAVFEEYHQLNANMTEGLGLGLAITKRVSGLLNHPVGVRSELGKGSVFHVSVPIADGMVVINPADEQEDISANFLAGRMILCIDDEINITEALSELLKRWGANVWSAQNYEQYQALLKEGHRFDVILA
ncbi:MAG TPA: sensor histidine kinase, partial [Cycloclasticus sp.]|nr:sensor histidine kinase [Cycloclasticus sp.]